MTPQVDKDKYNPYLSLVLIITHSTSLLAVKIIFQQTTEVNLGNDTDQ